MDGNGDLNLRNWGFIDPPNSNGNLKNHLGLQLMSSLEEKPFFGGGIRDHHHAAQPPPMASANHLRVGGIPESHFSMDCWMNHNRDKFVNVFTGNNHQQYNGIGSYYQPNYGVGVGVAPETSSVHIPQQIILPKNETLIPLKLEEVREEKDNVSCGSGSGLLKKRSGGKVPKSPPKEKKPRSRAPKAQKDDSVPTVHRARVPKKQAELVINGINMDISRIAIPVCSCTGTPQQCYRWGSGGWQSACCTTSLSTYPLPVSTKRRGARIAGRKMSFGAFKKVLENLASNGYDFSNPIDLKNYWCKHGTNKFQTIR